MYDSRIIIILICLMVSLRSCVPRRRKSATTQIFHRTGEPIAVNDLIKQYEREHHKFYNKLTNEGDYLEWPAMDNKDLSNYCKRYLQCVIPSRANDSATGSKMRKTLHYEKVNTYNTSEIILIQCKIRYKTFQIAYYMTTAPEQNCVYALKCSGKRKVYTFVIIHKHCDFEEKSLIKRSLKRKWTEVIIGRHHGTGQPIAKDKYLLEYELEHEGLIKKHGIKGKRLEWPHAVVHHNLNLYCYQYLGECCPNRSREGVSGSWSYEKLHYEKLNREYVDVVIIKCALYYATTQLNYKTTRAPESNCVYTLLRNGHGAKVPLVIIFKHCDFEDSSNYQQTNPKNIDNLNKNPFPKTEVKEETSEISEVLPLFPED